MTHTRNLLISNVGDDGIARYTSTLDGRIAVVSDLRFLGTASSQSSFSYPSAGSILSSSYFSLQQTNMHCLQVPVCRFYVHPLH
ncbi:hypothetical protein PILCRDRAFT_818472 [Piloderma croceum F 1598]|uniref:Uncharacterized protein n=1 Tax=Piloderma croceum (strain F 1598) TaxID=765440 RepID=A0A0C3BCW5_PILCF|nr:hypothetical protein PILCRDRAFT_818472 [Piloderma croceum F 1598]